MKNRARWLVVFGLIGMYAGLHRGQLGLASISLAVLIWVFVEWARFSVRVWFERPTLDFVRTINGRDESLTTLWAGRNIDVKLTVTSGYRNRLQAEKAETAGENSKLPFTKAVNNWRGMSPSLTIRDIVPEILRLPEEESSKPPSLSTELALQKTAAQENEATATRARRGGFSRLGNWIRRLFATDLSSKKNQGLTKNQCTLNHFAKQVEFSYRAQALAAGTCELPGVRLTFSDDFGFFEHQHILSRPQQMRILPDYFQSGEIRPVVKRFNSLPSHGIHRLKNAGTGAELLELRDYVAGDPPKSIAWKASARRQKLMIRQYESEVPVRIQMFLDYSFSARLGGYGKRLIDQMNFVAASVAKAASSVGDPFSATLIDANGSTRLPWFGGDLGFLRLLRALAEFSQKPADIPLELTPHAQRVALAIISERYPYLMNRNYQRQPLSLFSNTRRRYRLSAILAELNDLSSKEQVACCMDDRVLAKYVRKLMIETGSPWMSPLVSQAHMSGTVPAEDPVDSHLRPIAESLTTATLRAKDNEVFALFIDPQWCVPLLHEVLPAIKLARAKHHRVVIVCPATTMVRPESRPIRPTSTSVQDLLHAAELSRMRGLLERMQSECRKLGVHVSFTGEKKAARQVLAEMDLARDGRTRGAGASV